MSILKAFVSSIRETLASSDDYNKICLDAFNKLPNDQKIRAKNIIDDAVDYSNKNNYDPLKTNRHIHTMLSLCVLRMGNADALKVFADGGINNELLLREAVVYCNLDAAKMFLEAGANPDTRYNTKSSSFSSVGYGNFNCLFRSCLNRHYSSCKNEENREDACLNDEKMTLLLLDHGASLQSDSVRIDAFSSSGLENGKGMFENSGMSFSLDDYKQAREDNNKTPTTIDQITAARLKNETNNNLRASNLKESFKI